MAARSELSHRLRELKLAVMGRLVPSDEPTDPDLLHPEDVPEIVTRRTAQPAGEPEAGDQLGAPRRACTQG